MCIGSTCLLQYIQSIFRDLLVFLDSGREKESGSMEDVTWKMDEVAEQREKRNYGVLEHWRKE